MAMGWMYQVVFHVMQLTAKYANPTIQYATYVKNIMDGTQIQAIVFLALKIVVNVFLVIILYARYVILNITWVAHSVLNVWQAVRLVLMAVNVLIVALDIIWLVMQRIVLLVLTIVTYVSWTLLIMHHNALYVHLKVSLILIVTQQFVDKYAETAGQITIHVTIH